MIQLVKVLDGIFGVHVGDIQFSLKIPHMERVQHTFPFGDLLKRLYYHHGMFELGLTFETMQPLPKNNFGSILLSPMGSSKVRTYFTETDGARTVIENTTYHYIATLLMGEETNSIVSAIAQDIHGK